MAAKSQHSHAADTKGVTSTVATTDNGTIQITFSVPKSLIDSEEQKVLLELQQSTKVPGFRPGKAPLDKVKAKTDAGHLLEHTLQHILPHAFTDAVQEHKLKPAIYPRFEILSQEDPWQVRATTCTIPEVTLTDYKKIAAEALATGVILKPGDDTKPAPTREEKESKVLEALIKGIEVKIPQLLIEEEVNSRLAQLLERIEKLGLNLESYLSSLGKDTEGLRKEYEEQARQAISLEFILNAIADKEEVKISEDDINKATTATQIDPSQRRMIESVLRRRAVLDALIGQS